MRHPAISLAARLAIALALGVCAVATGAEAGSTATTTTNDRPAAHFDLQRLAELLDPSSSDVVRNAARAEMLAAADAGNAYAQYDAGVLYRQGDAHPAKVFPRDLPRARTLLLAAALQGQLSALAKLAEVEFDAGEYAEAMDWAQMYTHYLREGNEFEAWRAGHIAAMLKRIDDKLGHPDAETVRQRVIVKLDRYGPTIEAAQSRAVQSPASPTLLHMPVSKRHQVGTHRKANVPETPGVAEFVIAVDTSGHVNKFWLLDATPSADLANQLNAVVRDLRFNDAPKGSAEMRYAVAPVAFNNQRFHLQQK